jgi:quercetin dioxygenase-like cupin family protein
MNGKFILGSELERVVLDWGEQGWFSKPDITGTEKLVVVEVEIFPGFGHAFHRHPNQEEVIFVLEGEVEQWLETEKRHLKAGDSVFIPMDVVHATFNVSDKPVKALAILGPSIGAEGYEVVEVFEQEPWSQLRD